jgi:branched-chain amino acid transport system permease protein
VTGRMALLGAAALYAAILLLHGDLGGGIDWISDYYLQVLMLAGINIIVTVGLNLINGFAGQFSIGQAGFMAIGAYLTAMLAKFAIPLEGLPLHWQIAGYLAILLAAGSVAGLIGLLIGLPSLRLKGDYLAIVTLAFGEVVRSIIRASDEIAALLRDWGLSGLASVIEGIGGPRGFGGFPQFETVAVAGVRIPVLFTLTFVLMIGSVILARNLVYSSYGRVWLSVRGNEIAAEAMGVNSTHAKILAFACSGFLAAVGGGLFAFVIRFLHPDNFSFLKSIEYLIFLYAGGMASLSGSIIAASTLTVLPEFLRVAGFGEWRLVFYPLLLIAIMLWRPSGLMGNREFPFLVPPAPPAAPGTDERLVPSAPAVHPRGRDAGD